MNRKGYKIVGWVVWQVASRLAKRKLAQNRRKIGVAGATALGLIATKLVSGDD